MAGHVSLRLTSLRVCQSAVVRAPIFVKILSSQTIRLERSLGHFPKDTAFRKPFQKLRNLKLSGCYGYSVLSWSTVCKVYDKHSDTFYL